jgi:4-amino-4-deoxy-L-arabinose transferase-like glycosyltransferase
MVWALAALLRGWQSMGPAYGWFATGGLLIGLSILSKGPVAPYGMLLPFVVSMAWRGGWSQLKTHGRGAVLAVLVALVVGASWPLYVLSQHQEAAVAVARLESSSWAERHVKPLWYYFSFPVFTGIWTLAALAALAWPYARPRLRSWVPYGLLLTWVVLTIVVLSLIPEKKERYLLPVMPPLALLTAAMVQYWAQQVASSVDRRLQQIWGGVLVVVGLTVPVGLAILRMPDFQPGSARFWVSAAVFGALAFAALLVTLRGSRASYLAGLSLLSVVLITSLLMPIYPQWERRKADAGLRPLAEVLRVHPELRRWSVYSTEDMHIKLIWAAGRSVPVLNQQINTLPAATMPGVLLYSTSRAAPALPASWRRLFQVSLIDSFTLSDKLKDGRNYVLRLKRH